jgi:hypothetical protein
METKIIYGLLTTAPSDGRRQINGKEGKTPELLYQDKERIKEIRDPL